MTPTEGRESGKVRRDRGVGRASAASSAADDAGPTGTTAEPALDTSTNPPANGVNDDGQAK
jgi:hypothetical protein